MEGTATVVEKSTSRCNAHEPMVERLTRVEETTTHTHELVVEMRGDMRGIRDQLGSTTIQTAAVQATGAGAAKTISIMIAAGAVTAASVAAFAAVIKLLITV